MDDGLEARPRLPPPFPSVRVTLGSSGVGLAETARHGTATWNASQRPTLCFRSDDGGAGGSTFVELFLLAHCISGLDNGTISFRALPDRHGGVFLIFSELFRFSRFISSSGFVIHRRVAWVRARAGHRRVEVPSEGNRRS